MTHPPSVRAAAPLPVADLDRRFYAFVVDQLVSWTLLALACWAAYELFWPEDRVWPGVILVAVATVLSWLAFAALLGLGGTSPGKAAAGVRVVGESTGTPIGAGPALARGLVLVLVTVAAFGIGLATLAWTAVADPGRRRRGWHDRLAGSLVVDARPRVAPAAGGETLRGTW